LLDVEPFAQNITPAFLKTFVLWQSYVTSHAHPCEF